MKAYLIRHIRTTKETLGYLVISNLMFTTLEPPWRNNQRNISCIPAGTYKATFLAKSASGKYKNIFYLSSVPSRSGILIHNGNIHSHTRGCIILGTRFGILANNNAVLNSRTAMRQLADYVNKQSFEIKVLDGLVS